MQHTWEQLPKQHNAMPLSCLVAGALLLAGCGGSSSPPAPTVNPPFSGAIALSSWSITQSSMPRPTNYGGFNFQNCASASVCWDSYVEVPLPVSILGNSSYSITYTITGDNPIWVNDSPGNTCGGPGTLRLLLHRQGDTLAAVPGFRYYSIAQPVLALGTTAVTNPTGDPSQWITTDGSNATTNGQLFIDALTHLGSVGFVLGGGCFAGHGVAVSSGSAVFQLNSASIQ